MSDADFLDTNIFAYIFDDRAPVKRERASRLIGEALLSADGAISYQVVQETLNVFSRRLDPPMPPDRAAAFFEMVLQPLWRVNPSPELYGRALAIRERYQYSFYDSLIIAAALEAGCDRLLSEDLQHGQEIEGLRIENPFLT
jgi:predicted nucleic acid-binding protein